VVSFNLQGLLFLPGSLPSEHSAQPLGPRAARKRGPSDKRTKETWGWGTIGTIGVRLRLHDGTSDGEPRLQGPGRGLPKSAKTLGKDGCWTHLSPHQPMDGLRN
jgi:hypothetical protein